MDNLLEKRQLGSTNLNVSRLCFGTLSLGPYHSNLTLKDGSDLLVQAYNCGVNFWDTAELYETNPYILEALKKLNYPDDLIIASRSFSRTYEEMKNSINSTLEFLNLKSIPLFGIHELFDQEDFENSQGAITALKEAKDKGLIKNILISMHSVDSVKIATSQDWVDVIFPLYNKAGIGIKNGNTADMTQAIKNAFDAGKGLYAMKVLAGGHLSSNPEESIRFVMDNHDIHSIAIGMDNINELQYNIALFNNQADKLEYYNKLTKAHKKVIHIDPWCEGCGECIKMCPNNALSIQFSQACVDPEKCILCGYCASVCKYFCLKVVNCL